MKIINFSHCIHIVKQFAVYIPAGGYTDRKNIPAEFEFLTFFCKRWIYQLIIVEQ